MIYAIDFDGTIVEDKFPEIGEIKPEAKEFIRKLQERGDKWILYTMREGHYLDEALEFLCNLNLDPDAVNNNLLEMCELYDNNPRKVYADVYIDDHNAGGLLFAEDALKAENKDARPEYIEGKKQTCEDFMPTTVFDHITASPEVLVPKFVYNKVYMEHQGDLSYWVSSYFSTIIPGKSWEHESEAISATAEKLKEVYND